MLFCCNSHRSRGKKIPTVNLLITVLTSNFLSQKNQQHNNSIILFLSDWFLFLIFIFSVFSLSPPHRVNISWQYSFHQNKQLQCVSYFILYSTTVHHKIYCIYRLFLIKQTFVGSCSLSVSLSRSLCLVITGIIGPKV